MAKQKRTILLKGVGEEYHLTETGQDSTYLGRVYHLTNDNRDYAVIFDRELQTLSGPPMKTQLLLQSGTLPSMKEKLFLSKVTHLRARQQADILAKRLKLKVIEDIVSS